MSSDKLQAFRERVKKLTIEQLFFKLQPQSYSNQRKTNSKIRGNKITTFPLKIYSIITLFYVLQFGKQQNPNLLSLKSIFLPIDDASKYLITKVSAQPTPIDRNQVSHYSSSNNRATKILEKKQMRKESKIVEFEISESPIARHFDTSNKIEMVDPAVLFQRRFENEILRQYTVFGEGNKIFEVDNANIIDQIDNLLQAQVPEDQKRKKKKNQQSRVTITIQQDGNNIKQDFQEQNKFDDTVFQRKEQAALTPIYLNPPIEDELEYQQKSNEETQEIQPQIRYFHQREETWPRGKTFCYQCKILSHHPDDCQAIINRLKSRCLYCLGDHQEDHCMGVCFKCCQYNHLSKNCYQFQQNSKTSCFRCGKMGHSSRECGVILNTWGRDQQENFYNGEYKSKIMCLNSGQQSPYIFQRGNPHIQNYQSDDKIYARNYLGYLGEQDIKRIDKQYDQMVRRNQNIYEFLQNNDSDESSDENQSFSSQDNHNYSNKNKKQKIIFSEDEDEGDQVYINFQTDQNTPLKKQWEQTISSGQETYSKEEFKDNKHYAQNQRKNYFQENNSKYSKIVKSFSKGDTSKQKQTTSKQNGKYNREEKNYSQLREQQNQRYKRKSYERYQH